MTRLLLRRVLASLVVLWLASILVFVLSRASGDPRHLFISEYTTKEQWDAWGQKFGLDRPKPVQYAIWLRGVVQLDFGESLRDHVPSIVTVARKIPATLQLALGAFLFAVGVGVPLGVFAAITAGPAGTSLGELSR